MAESLKPAGGESIKSLLRRLDAEEHASDGTAAPSFEEFTAGLSARRMSDSGAPSPATNQSYSLDPQPLSTLKNTNQPNHSRNAPQAIVTPASDANDNIPLKDEQPVQIRPKNATADSGFVKWVAGTMTVLGALIVSSSWLWMSSSEPWPSLFSTASTNAPSGAVSTGKSSGTPTPNANSTEDNGQRLELAAGARLLDETKNMDQGLVLPRSNTAPKSTRAASDVSNPTSPSSVETSDVTMPASGADPLRNNRVAAVSKLGGPKETTPPATPNATAAALQSNGGYSTDDTAPETRLVAAASNALGDWLFESGRDRQSVHLKAEPFISTKGGRQIKLPFQIDPPSAASEIASIVLRGLPEGYTVSAASAVGDGSWVLVPSSLSIARIAIPEVAAQKIDLDISIFSIEADLLANRRVQLTITPDHVSRSLTKQDASALITRGGELFESGDIAGARLLFERAAEAGDAQGAYALGATYDSDKLAEKGVLGMSGDPEKARKWYTRAQQQGIAEAAARLKKITGTKPASPKP